MNFTASSAAKHRLCYLIILALLTPLAAAAQPWGGNGMMTMASPGGGGPPPSLVLPAVNNVSANWQKVGLLSLGGIPNRTTQCNATVTPSGLTPPVANDDAAKINAAISVCTAGQVVQLAAGTFQIDQSEYILLNKGVTLRGSGSPTNTCGTPGGAPCWPTVLNVYNGAIPDWSISSTTAGTNCGVDTAHLVPCSAPTGAILISPSSVYNWAWAGCGFGSTPTGCGTTIDADAAQGATTVQVHSTTNFSVGGWVLIDEDPQMVSTANPTGGANIQASSEFLNSTSSPATMRLANPDASSNYSFAPNRVNQEIHLVTAIGAGPCPGAACTLTFDSPLSLAFRQSGSHNAQVYWPTVQSGGAANPFVSQAGVENLSITKPANGGVHLQFAANSWVTNVEVGNWIAGAVDILFSARNQVEANYFHDCTDCENNGAEYPFDISMASTENLAQNNIIVRGGKGMVGRAAPANVVAYNYVDDTFYMQSVIGDYWMDMGVNGSHYAGTHHFLFEGNEASNCDNDETHGNAIYHTYFRNHCRGIRATFTDPSQAHTVNDSVANGCWGQGGGASPPVTQCAPLRAAGPMAFDYWLAYVGNVLGLSGVTTSANGWVYQCVPSNKCIWMSGWVGSEWPGPDHNLTAAASPAFIFRNGNYDYVNGAVPDWAAGYSNSLPNSLYVSAKPAFFTANYPSWPWVTPENGTTPIQSGCGGTCSGLPAKARFDAGTPFTQP